MASQNGVITFAIDIGGTGIKGMLLDARGKPLTERLRKDTPHPATPVAMLRVIESIAKRTMADLNPTAVQRFLSLWNEKVGRSQSGSVEQQLENAELLIGGKITYAALILFGTRAALGRHLAQAEIIFEYRSSESSIPYQQREEFRQGFFATLDELWRLVDLRNDVPHYEDGLFVRQIPTFNERAVREAILNAVTHRDYRLARFDLHPPVSAETDNRQSRRASEWHHVGKHSGSPGSSQQAHCGSLRSLQPGRAFGPGHRSHLSQPHRRRQARTGLHRD